MVQYIRDPGNVYRVPVRNLQSPTEQWSRLATPKDAALTVCLAGIEGPKVRIGRAEVGSQGLRWVEGKRPEARAVKGKSDDIQ